MATRTSRVPLGQRSANIQNGAVSVKSSSSSLLGKKDSSSLKPGIAFEKNLSDSGNNKAISSMSSNTLRRALSASSANSEASTNAETGAGATAGLANQFVSSSSTLLTDKTNTPDSIIIEHRKRPSGEGYTVHKYMRGKLLGKGGFAKVYQVTSLDTNKIYAAKIVPKANLFKNRARQKVRICCCVLAAFSYLPSHHSPLSYSISTASDRDQNSQDNETCECL